MLYNDTAVTIHSEQKHGVSSYDGTESIKIDFEHNLRSAHDACTCIWLVTCQTKPIEREGTHAKVCCGSIWMSNVVWWIFWELVPHHLSLTSEDQLLPSTNFLCQSFSFKPLFYIFCFKLYSFSLVMPMIWFYWGFFSYLCGFFVTSNPFTPAEGKHVYTLYTWAWQLCQQLSGSQNVRQHSSQAQNQSFLDWSG